MTIAADLLPDWLVLALWLVCAATVLLTLRFADWRALRTAPQRAHLVYGGTVSCVVLWLISVTTIEGLWLHFLGVTTLTLLLGWRFAILAGSVAVIAHTLIIGQPLNAAPAAWLLTVAVPATVSRWLVYRLRKLKSRNLFVYMLGAGFGGGLISALALALVAIGLFWIGGQQAWSREALAHWPLLVLLLFPEGFINGMMVTTLTVFYPNLVRTFDDSYYLEGP